MSEDTAFWDFTSVLKGQQFVLIAFKEEGSALADVYMANKLTAPQISALGRRLLILAERAIDRVQEDHPRITGDVFLPRQVGMEPELCEPLIQIEKKQPCILVRWEKVGGVRVDCEPYGPVCAGQLLTVGSHLIAQSDYVYRQAFPTAEAKASASRILTPAGKTTLVGIPGGRN